MHILVSTIKLIPRLKTALYLSPWRSRFYYYYDSMNSKAQKTRKARDVYYFDEYTYRCPTGVYFRCEQCPYEKEITEWLFLKNGHQWCLHMGKFHRCGVKGESGTYKTYRCSKKCLPNYAADWSTLSNDTAKKMLRNGGLFKVNDVASRPCVSVVPDDVLAHANPTNTSLTYKKNSNSNCSRTRESSRKKKLVLVAAPEDGHTATENANRICRTRPSTSQRKRKKTTFPVAEDRNCETSTPKMKEQDIHMPLKKRRVACCATTPSEIGLSGKLEECATKKQWRERELARSIAACGLSRNIDPLDALRAKTLFNFMIFSLAMSRR
jgi:hypothetical protein